MNSNSSSAYFLSVTLHGLALALILLVAYIADVVPPPQDKVFELVAGEGDNYAATDAPALGSPDGVKISIPKMIQAPPAPAAPPAPPTLPMPPPPTPAAPSTHASPVQPAPTALPKPAQTVPNFAKSVSRTINRKVARLEAQYKKELAAERKKELSYEQYEKEHRMAGSPRDSDSKIDAEGIRQGVIGGSTANKTGGAGGKALTREEGKLLDAYFALLLQHIRENYIAPPGVTNVGEPTVEIYIAADGSLSAGRIVHSSGNADFDRAILDAIVRTHSIGPRPDNRGELDSFKIEMKDDSE